MNKVDHQKNSYGRLIAAATLILPLGLGKFGHVLNVDLQKIKISIADHFINETFASGKFLNLIGEKHEEPSGNTALCMCVQPTVSPHN